MQELRQAQFHRVAIGVLAFTLMVILWGAIVRATGSGAGCGEHWPLCNGQALPINPRIETMIEFGHRASSGILLIIICAAAYFGFKAFPKSQYSGHPIRLFCTLSVAFIFGEALVGALLVLKKYVADNDSAWRAVVIALHLINTYFLIGSIAGLVWFSAEKFRKSQLTRVKVRMWEKVSIVLLLFVGTSGAIVALGDTLFPAQSLAQGLLADMAEDSHFLLRLRILHPAAATLTSLWVVIGCTWRNSVYYSKWVAILSWATVGQFLFGVLNLSLLAPIWAQIVHLLFADLVWCAFCFVFFNSVYRRIKAS